MRLLVTAKHATLYRRARADIGAIVITSIYSFSPMFLIFNI